MNTRPLRYEQWSTGGAAYLDSQQFYVNVLSQFQTGQFLELGIGTGRISLAALQKAPISIVGVDRCREMLAECYRKSLCQPLTGTLTLSEADFCSLDIQEKFDGVIMSFHTIGHLLTDKRLEMLFRVAFRALRLGG